MRRIVNRLRRLARLGSLIEVGRSLGRELVVTLAGVWASEALSS
jgi:hypothetical protein